MDAADHRVRRSPAGGSRRARLARLDAGDAAQLDRPQRGGRGRVSERVAGRGQGDPRLHDAARHALRRDLHGARARAPAGRRADDARAARGGRRRIRRRRGARATSSAPISPRTRPASSPARPRPTRSPASRSRSGSPTTCSRATAPAPSWPCPAHDERDFAFAQRFALPIIQVVAPASGGARPRRTSPSPTKGRPSIQARSTGCRRPRPSGPSPRDLEARGVGKGAVSYRLRDWVFSRQRYWGEPLPLIHCPTDGVVPVPEAQLPVRLPDVETYAPTGTGESPLAGIEEWVATTCPKCGGPAKRETNTMPQWAGSCWYYLRFLDPEGRRARVRSGRREGLDGRRSLRRRRRARRPAPALRALLAQGALRHGDRAHEGAVPEAAPPGDGALVLVPGQPRALPRPRRRRAARRQAGPAARPARR